MEPNVDTFYSCPFSVIHLKYNLEKFQYLNIVSHWKKNAIVFHKYSIGHIFHSKPRLIILLLFFIKNIYKQQHC